MNAKEHDLMQRLAEPEQVPVVSVHKKINRRAVQALVDELIEEVRSEAYQEGREAGLRTAALGSKQSPAATKGGEPGPFDACVCYRTSMSNCPVHGSDHAAQVPAEPFVLPANPMPEGHCKCPVRIGLTCRVCGLPVYQGWGRYA